MSIKTTAERTSTRRTTSPAGGAASPLVTADLAPVGGRASRGFFRQAVVDTWAKWGAGVGFVWIVFLAVCAVFGPFIASSWPYAVKIDGKWCSPLLRHLTPPDVILLIVTFSGLAMILSRRVRLETAMITLCVELVVVIPACYLLVHPPAVNVFDTYRELG